MNNYKDFYRCSIGIALFNSHGKLWVGRRSVRDKYWQMPQGGIENDETPTESLYREIKEELGLLAQHIKIVKIHDQWLKYNLPSKFFWFKNNQSRCIGQKQKWFLCSLITGDDCIDINHSGTAEFIDWCWQNPAMLPKLVIDFKKKLYDKLIEDFIPWIKAQR